MNPSQLREGEVCGCCGGRIELVDAPQFPDYRRTVCNVCGYEKFLIGAARDYSEMYSNDADYQDDLVVNRSGNDMMLWHHWQALRVLSEARVQKGTTVLDVGCFNGFFVKTLCQFGYEAYGVDFNTAAIAFGQSRFALADRLSCSSIEELEAHGKSFGVIFLFEVLEHLPDPAAMLFAVARLLAPNGILVISTPNKDMCWRPALDFPPHHLSRFTGESLRKLIEKAELHYIFGREQMSALELVRHFTGSLFRDKSKPSLRGGEFRYKRVTTALRRGMNSSRKMLNTLLVPVDYVLYHAGCRYISQIAVARRQTDASVAGAHPTKSP